MSFQSLMAHNGVTHQKSSPEPKVTPSIAETRTNREPNANSKTVLPEGNFTSEKQVVETPENYPEALTTTETQATSNLTNATLVPGFGESIFTLLIASPFLLFGFKKWLHR